MKTAELSDRLMNGEPRALARAISLAEENSPRAIELLREVFPRTGKARVLNIAPEKQESNRNSACLASISLAQVLIWLMPRDFRANPMSSRLGFGASAGTR